MSAGPEEITGAKGFTLLEEPGFSGFGDICFLVQMVFVLEVSKYRLQSTEEEKYWNLTNISWNLKKLFAQSELLWKGGAGEVDILTSLFGMRKLLQLSEGWEKSFPV